jgi:hypothetical protein
MISTIVIEDNCQWLIDLADCDSVILRFVTLPDTLIRIGKNSHNFS